MNYDLHALISVFKHVYSYLLYRFFLRSLVASYALHALIRENKVGALKAAIESGADVNVQDRMGNTPLLLAFLEWAWPSISMNNEGVVTDELIECLLNYNPDVTIANENGTTPLHYAVLGDNIKFIKALIERGADINARDNLQATPLLKVLDKGKGYALEVIKCLLENGADINAQNSMGMTPLLLALLCSKKEVNNELIECLLNYNPDVTIANENGTTPLHLVPLRNSIKFIKALIERGADINARDKLLQATPLLKVLDWRGRQNDMEVIKCLLENGADINARDKYGKTVLHQTVGDWGSKYNMLTLIEYLLQSGVDINAQDVDGFTPLIRAMCTIACNETHIALLLRYNPNVTISDTWGRTAVCYMYDRHDLSDSIKGIILLRSVPGLRRWRLESFINAFRMQSPFPGELYNAITPEFIALVHPEIPLEMKVRWLKAYDEKVFGIGKEQVSEAEEQALPYETGCRP
jgi:ankyrin repeat protein